MLLPVHTDATLLSPECPTEVWWELARPHPLEAMSSVLFPLLTLESPERWVALVARNCTSWIDAVLKTLPNAQAQLFAADCVEHVLPFYEASHTAQVCAELLETTVRRSIEERRRFVRGEPVADFFVANTASAWKTAWGAQSAVEWARKWTPLKKKQAEAEWQWHRLLQYLRGEVP